jgi:hypothetical protein
VLFCFLCSDSDTPDFTDTDWLDILNEMGQRVYLKEDHVTSEEAQQILEGLKGYKFLWGQDGTHLTEDAEDETMYRFTKRAAMKNIVDDVYRCSSFTRTVKYLRSRRYIRKPGEKCVICPPTRCEPLFFRHLQMNILTHATTDDMDILNKVPPICKLIM